MTSELSGATQLLQTSSFKNWTNINEQTMNLTDTSASYYFPANANTVYLKQTVAGTCNVELPLPLALTDGQSRMWFCYWNLSSAAAAADCSLVLIRPVAVSTAYYTYPATNIQRTASDYTISRTYSGGDTRTTLGFIVWCTTANNYYVAAMGDAANFSTIVAGTGAYGQATSAPAFSAGSWKVNAYSGQNVTFAGTTANGNAGAFGPIGYNNTAASAGYWLVNQPGQLAQLRFASAANITSTITLTKNTVASALTLNAVASQSGADNVNSVTVAAGDKIQVTITDPGASTITSVSFVFRPSAV